MTNRDAMHNAAEINAELETAKLFFRSANEIEAAVKRVLTEAYIKGYQDAESYYNNNLKSN